MLDVARWTGPIPGSHRPAHRGQPSTARRRHRRAARGPALRCGRRVGTVQSAPTLAPQLPRPVPRGAWPTARDLRRSVGHGAHQRRHPASPPPPRPGVDRRQGRGATGRRHRPALDGLERWKTDPATRSEFFRPFDPGQDRSLHQVRAFVAGHHCVLVTDAPTAMFELIDALRATNVLECIEGHLGERPLMSIHKSTFRLSRPSKNITGWHQDGAFIGDGGGPSTSGSR